MIKKAASLVLFLALVYQAIRPPPPKTCSTAGLPSTTPSIKLRDGRHLVYKEYGVPKNSANYNVIYVHSFGGSKFEAALITSVRKKFTSGEFGTTGVIFSKKKKKKVVSGVWNIY